MITLEYFNGKEWINTGRFNNEWMCWASLGGDNYNYRTVDENGKVLTDKSGDEFSTRRLCQMRCLRRQPLQQRDAGCDIQGQEHTRCSGNEHQSGY